MRLLHRLRADDDVGNSVALADEVDLLLGPGALEDLDTLFHEGHAVAHLETKRGEVTVLVPHADAEDEAALGDDVDDRAVLGESRGVVKRQENEARGGPGSPGWGGGGRP